MQMPPDCIRVLFSRLDYIANALEPKKVGISEEMPQTGAFCRPAVHFSAKAVSQARDLVARLADGRTLSVA